MFTLINVFALAASPVWNTLEMVDLLHYQLSPIISLCEQFSLKYLIFWPYFLYTMYHNE